MLRCSVSLLPCMWKLRLEGLHMDLLLPRVQRSQCLRLLAGFFLSLRERKKQKSLDLHEEAVRGEKRWWVGCWKETLEQTEMTKEILKVFPVGSVL